MGLSNLAVRRVHWIFLQNNKQKVEMHIISTIFENRDRYIKPTLFITETPPEEGFFMSTGKGDIDDPNEEEWENPFA